MDKLSSRERLLRTLRQEPVDRVPIWAPIPWTPLTPEPAPGEWKSLPNYQCLVERARQDCDFLVQLIIPEATPIGESASDSTLEGAERRGAYAGFFDRRFFLSPPERIEVHETLAPHGRRLFTHTVHTPRGDLTGVDAVLPGVDSIWEIEPLVKSVEEAEMMLSLPHRVDPLDLQGVFADRERLGDGGLVCHFITSPMVMVTHAVGFQRFLEWTITERALAERLVEAAYERVKERLAYLLQFDVGPLLRFGGSEQATPPMMSSRGFDDFIVKYESPLWKMARQAGKIVWVHCHGKTRTVLDRYLDGGVQMLDPVEPPPQGDVTMEEAKRRSLPAGMTLVGGVEFSDVQTLAPPEIDRIVREVVLAGGRQGLILSASDVTISQVDDRTRDNVLQFIASGVKYGSF